MCFISHKRACFHFIPKMVRPFDPKEIFISYRKQCAIDLKKLQRSKSSLNLHNFIIYIEQLCMYLVFDDVSLSQKIR